MNEEGGIIAVGATSASPRSALTPLPPSPGSTGEGGSPPIDLGPRGKVVVVDDGSALARTAAEWFAGSVERAVAERGKAFVALSGGSTPKQMGGLLAREPYRSRIPWDRVVVFWGDERWVPLGSPESNAGEAMRGFLDLVPIPRANIHAWNTDAESPEEAAVDYESQVREAFTEPNAIPRFDLVLLGMGDDGHTASLFPNTAALTELAPLAVANFVPKFGAMRMTLTAPVLNNGREILFLIGGPGKADRLEAVLEGPEAPFEMPAQMIRPAQPDGALFWLVDEDAAAKLNRRDA